MGKLGGTLRQVGSNVATHGHEDLLFGRLQRSLMKFLARRRRKSASGIFADVIRLQLLFVPPKAVPLMQLAVVGYRRPRRSGTGDCS